jgi:hypothetical protein
MPRKTFTAGDVLTASDMNTFLMDQAVQTFADSTARDSAISTATAPAGLVTYIEDTDAFEYWDGTEYKSFGTGPTGPTLEYLVIAGGGGGGSGDSGGGGAGGYRSSVSGESSGGGQSAESTFTFGTAINYPVTIGAGGAGAAGGGNMGVNGVATTFATIQSFGGGAGARNANGIIGGSGGGGADRTVVPRTGGAGTFGQGFKGGDCVTVDQAGGGGGAGGAAANGAAATNNPGGIGLSSSVTGTAVTRAEGGKGDSTSVVSGAANTGSGGDGTDATAGTGGSGGSGVVILKYPTSFTITLGAGLTGTTSTVGSNKVTIITAGTGEVSWAA